MPIQSISFQGIKETAGMLKNKGSQAINFAKDKTARATEKPAAFAKSHKALTATLGAVAAAAVASVVLYRKGVIGANSPKSMTKFGAQALESAKEALSKAQAEIAAVEGKAEGAIVLEDGSTNFLKLGAEGGINNLFLKTEALENGGLKAQSIIEFNNEKQIARVLNGTTTDPKGVTEFTTRYEFFPEGGLKSFKSAQGEAVFSDEGKVIQGTLKKDGELLSFFTNEKGKLTLDK